jgi:plasmid stability protein
MSALLIKNMPPTLHERLRRRAVEHHRSMNREVIAILEKEIGAGQPAELPPPIKLRKPVDGAWIVKIIREARDSRP